MKDSFLAWGNVGGEGDDTSMAHKFLEYWEWAAFAKAVHSEGMAERVGMEFGASDSDHMFFDNSVDEHAGWAVVSFPSFTGPFGLGEEVVVVWVFFSPFKVDEGEVEEVDIGEFGVHGDISDGEQSEVIFGD